MSEELGAIIQEHLAEAVAEYPNLRLIPASDAYIVRGVLDRPIDWHGVVLQDSFQVEIRFSDDYPTSMPQIWEVGGRIPTDFHPLDDESFCFGEPLQIMRKFGENPTLLGFLNDLVGPYLFSFLYYEKHGVMPWGELSHSGEGILQYYRELFGVSSDEVVLELLELLSIRRPRGHQACPCGSGSRLRNCHGEIISKLRDAHDERLLTGLYSYCAKYLRRREENIAEAFRRRR